MKGTKNLVYESDDENIKSNANKKDQKKKQSGVTQNVVQGVHSASFKEFHLKNELNKAIGDAGFEQPSEVQQNVIPLSLAGDDIICQAKSGTGKTAVFTLSVLNRLKFDTDHVQSIIICPTRELAFQITKTFNKLGKYFKELKVLAIYGGDDIKKQKTNLEYANPQVVVGTPGRILYLAEKGYLNLKNLSSFILDECDKILDQIGGLKRYERRCPKNIFKN